MYILKLQTLNAELASCYKQRLNYSSDAGVDLYCPREIVVAPHSQAKISFEIRCELIGDISQELKHFSYWLVPRSSICKTPLRMSNSIGLIDSSYRGEICAFVDNLSDHPYTVKALDRLFQLCLPSLEPIDMIDIDTTDSSTFLTSTLRGEGGFGSTGSNRT